MHEMAYCRNVADIVLEEASKANAAEVTGIYITIGYARDIVEDIFEKMLSWLLRDTVAQNAQLFLTRVPLTMKCSECGRVFPVDMRKPTEWACPECEASRYEPNSGFEFFVNDIEIVSKS